MFKLFFNIILHYKLLNPIYRLMLFNVKNIKTVNKIKRESPILVSLSVSEENFYNVGITLYSVFNQTISPDKVILWVSSKYELSELPYSITQYVKYGLEIRFIDAQDDYTKIIQTLRNFKKYIIVTAEEYIYYPNEWLAKLYISYISNQNDIQVHSVMQVKLADNKIMPIKKWEQFFKSEDASYKNFPIFDGGVLYPPECFNNEVFREDIYKKKIGTSCQTWFWFMAMISNRKIRLVKNHINNFSCTNLFYQIKKQYKEKKLSSQTDIQISRLFEYYGQNIISKIKSK